MLEKGGWIQLSCEYPSVVVTRLAERCDVDVLMMCMKHSTRWNDT